MIIYLNAQKSFDKTIRIHVRSIGKIRNSRPIKNIIKSIYCKSIANIILNGDILEAFSLKSRIRKGCPLPYIYSI